MKPCIITDQISQDFQYACSFISEAGITDVEIHSLWGKTVELLDDEQVNKAKTLLDFYDLKVVNLATTFFLMIPLYPDDLLKDFNPKSSIIRADYSSHMDYLRRTIRIAKMLGCPRLRVFPFYAPVNRLILGIPNDIATMAQVMQPAVRLAAQEGITLVLENCYRSHLPKGLMSLELVKKIDSPNLKLLYSPANSFRANIDRIPAEYRTVQLVDELKSILPWIDLIHIKDYHYAEGLNQPYQHVILGQGEVPYPQLLELLKENGYQGDLSCDPQTNFEGNMESLNVLLKWLKAIKRK